MSICVPTRSCATGESVETYNRAGARKLLTAGEYGLFEASTTAALADLSQSRLRQKIQHARELRDKYRDLLRRQRIATRRRSGTKSGRSGAANARTREKQQIFSEMLKRFEERLKRVEAASGRTRRAPGKTAEQRLRAKRKAQALQRAAREPDRSPKAPAKRKGHARGSSAGPTSESARAARHAMRFQASRTRAIQGHIGAAGRRAQTRRAMAIGAQGQTFEWSEERGTRRPAHELAPTSTLTELRVREGA